MRRREGEEESRREGGEKEGLESRAAPNVLKYSKPLDASATSRVVITADSGKPLPNGLPTVTMSGVARCASNAHM